MTNDYIFEGAPLVLGRKHSEGHAITDLNLLDHAMAVPLIGRLYLLANGLPSRPRYPTIIENNTRVGSDSVVSAGSLLRCPCPTNVISCTSHDSDLEHSTSLLYRRKEKRCYQIGLFCSLLRWDRAFAEILTK
jgi:hypothetical protein